MIEPDADRVVAGSANWRTTLAILRGCGAVVQQRPGYLVVTTPDNPGYHWGNCLVVTGDDVDDAVGWLDLFAREFPGATHRAIGFLRRPNAQAWLDAGVTLETERTLTSDVPIAPTPVPDGYAVAPVRDSGWDALLAAACAGEPATEEHRQFIERRLVAERRLVEAGQAEWFAAWTPDGSVASSLGIVALGDDARYQSVLTDASHRRRGLARHLLGVASEWAFGHGATRLVIVADDGHDGDRLYRAAGFLPGAVECNAYLGHVG